MALANVALTNTFDQWRTRTNQIIYALDQLSGNTINVINYANTAFYPLAGNETITGNVTITGRFANSTSNVYFSGNTVNISSRTMNVSSNVFFSGVVVDLLG